MNELSFSRSGAPFSRSEAPASERTAPEAPASRDERQLIADEAGASEQCVPGLEPWNESIN